MADQQPDSPQDDSEPHDTGEGIPTIISSPQLAAEKQNPSSTGNVAVGSKLGPYELVRKLGQGGMGAVYEARHQKLGKTFALKVLPGGFASNQAALTRFEREMQAIGKLDHPHIIKATDADEWQGTHYLVMEYVEGTDLSELVKARGPLSVRDACKAIRQAAMGLEHAHEHGLVHRDIKPSNLFVTKSGQIKLLDLGLARLGDDGEHQRGLTTVGQVLGTPDYMAPEQWDDTHSVDARADLYSLGCTLFFVLTGRAPYADVTKSSLLQLMKAHVEGAIPNLTDIRLDVPAELNAVFVRLLAKNADDRYANAGEVIAALEPFTRKGADTEGLAGQPAFVPGKEPPVAHSVESTSRGSNEGDRSAQRSIKSLSASSTDDAFGSNRPMIQSDRSASMVETIIQSRPQQSSRGRGPLVIGISLVSIAVLIGLAIHFTSKPATNSASRETSTAGQSSGDNKNEIQTPTGWHGWPADAPKPAIAPFDADQAKKHQEEWAAYLKVPVEYTNSIGMKFRIIPPGEFMMGSTLEEVEDASKRESSHWNWKVNVQSEAPRHKRSVPQPVYLGVHEVTQEQYETVMGNNPSSFAKAGNLPLGGASVDGLDTSSFPVDSVRWSDAVAFCEKLNAREAEALRLPNDSNSQSSPVRLSYHLPTEVTWEFACRAGTTSKYWSGDKEEDLWRAGWFQASSGNRTHKVGELGANPFGLFDTHGNVMEWCTDIWDASAYRNVVSNQVRKDAIDSDVPIAARVMRGGNWTDRESYSRSASRQGLTLTDCFGNMGFRVALTVDAVKTAISKGKNKASAESVGWYGWPADAPKPAIAPFDADKAKKHQEEWAAYLKVPVEYTNSIGMKFRLIPPGEFIMGTSKEEVEAIITKGGFSASNPSEKWVIDHLQAETPARTIRLTKPFYVSVNETRNRDFQEFTSLADFKTEAEKDGNGGTIWGKEKGDWINDPKVTWRSPGHDFPFEADHPVCQVSAHDAEAFCKWLSTQDAMTYRLCSEAEWEYMATAGTRSTFSMPAKEAMTIVGGILRAVGTTPANAFGIHDIDDGMQEWLADDSQTDAYGRFSSEDPREVIPSGMRLIRGGPTYCSPFARRRSTRQSMPPSYRRLTIGFRVLLSVDSVKAAKNKTSTTNPSASKGWHGWPADAPKPAIAPFDADQAKKHQEEWAAYLKVPVEYTNSIGMKFRLIPPGEFTMGSTSAEIEEALMFTGEVSHWKSCIQSEAPQHTVTLTRPIYLGVHEVTQEAFKKVMERNPSHFSAMGAGNGSVSGIDTSRHPVELVSWIDAAEFCTKLSTQENFRPFYSDSGEAVTQPEGNGYRLPTEAEWEFACRAGSTTTFWSGNNAQQLASCGWFGSNSRGRTHAVGELNANPLGLYDVHGNVFEWVQDWWDPAYYGQLKEKPAQNPDGATLSAHRSVRGGGWDHPASRCRSALRLASDPPYREHNLGFRVALTLDAVRTKTAEGK